MEIRQGGDVVRTGIVDGLMPDSSALWTATDGALPRRIFEASLGHEVWARPREPTGPRRFHMAAARPSDR